MSELKLLPEIEEPRIDLTDWAIRIGVGVLFILVGLDKFPNESSSFWVKMFLQIGFGDWFRYTAGIVEIVGGLFALIPRVCIHRRAAVDRNDGCRVTGPRLHSRR